MSDHIVGVGETKQPGFGRLAGDLPIYTVPCDDHVLYYAPRYLAVVAKGQEQTWLSGLAEQIADRNEQTAVHQGGQSAVSRKLIDAARTAVRHRAIAVQSPFRPQSLTLYLNRRCNLRCSYCYSTPHPRSLAQLAIKTIRRAARLVAGNCAEAGRPLTLVCHGGGEPTLDQEYLDRVVSAVERIASESGVPLMRYVATNGVLPAAKVSWLARRFDLIGLSCDGPPEIQDRQRPTWNGEPTAAIVERTAQILKREGADFQVRLTVTPSTVNQLPQAAGYLCRRIQPGEIWVEPVYYGGRTQEGFPAAGVSHFVDRFLAAREIAAEHGIPWLTSGNRLDQVHGPYCSLLQGSLQLLPDGAAAACFKVVESGENGGEQTIFSLREAAEFALDTGRSRQLQTILGTTPTVCRECINEFHCTFGCPDHCLLAGEPSISSFRCRLGRRLTYQKLGELGEKLWTDAQVNGGAAGMAIDARVMEGR